MEIEKILQSHKLWVESSGAEGARADLSRRDLRGRVFEGCILRKANLGHSNLSCCDISKADLNGADLIGTNLTCANLQDACLENVRLNRACLVFADLRGTSLCSAHLRSADLSGADLRRSVLKRAILMNTVGLVDPLKYLEDNFEHTEKGIIVYKVFDKYYFSPRRWNIKENSVIEELANYNRLESCTHGINVATKKWLIERGHITNVWKCLIKWEWLPGVVVPYATDGKIRCSRLKLLGLVEI